MLLKTCPVALVVVSLATTTLMSGVLPALADAPPENPFLKRGPMGWPWVGALVGSVLTPCSTICSSKNLECRDGETTLVNVFADYCRKALDFAYDGEIPSGKGEEGAPPVDAMRNAEGEYFAYGCNYFNEDSPDYRNMIRFAWREDFDMPNPVPKGCNAHHVPRNRRYDAPPIPGKHFCVCGDNRLLSSEEGRAYRERN